MHSGSAQGQNNVNANPTFTSFFFFSELGTSSAAELSDQHTLIMDAILNRFQLYHTPGKGEHGFIARKMQITLKSAAWSQQESADQIPSHPRGC